MITQPMYGLISNDKRWKIFISIIFFFLNTTWKNIIGLPYFYENEGFQELLEIPNQGYSDNYYRGLTKQTQMKMTLREEIEARIEDLSIALENNLLFAPAMHPWVTGLTDKEAFVIKEMLEFVK